MGLWALVLGGCGWLGGSKGEIPDVTDTPVVRDERGGRGGKRGRGRRDDGGGAADAMDQVTLTVDGRERSSFVVAPSSLPAGQKVPLVFMFHGAHADGTAGARVWLDHMDEDFILAFPNGQKWKPEFSGWTPTDGDIRQHVRFVDALIDELIAKYPVDPDRIYASGFSDGAQMTFRLACMLDQRFAGFAFVAQTMKDDTLAACKPQTAKPILYVTGSADPKNPSDGRAAPTDDRVGRIGIEDTLDFWLDRNQCQKAREQDRDLPDLPGDDTRVRERLFEQCRTDGPVRFLLVEGGGHSWPTRKEKGGDHCSDISAADEALAWWRAHAGFGG
jgi:polyhydroxybutyrate depolymerase